MSGHPLLRPGSTGAGAEDVIAPWTAACHDALRTAGGRVTGGVDRPTAGRNYARVEASLGETRLVLLLNPVLRLVAAASATGGVVLEFLDVPAPDVFGLHGFTVTDVAEVARDVHEADVVDLLPEERADVRYHRPDRIGDVLFNRFD